MLRNIKYFVEQSWLLIVASFVFGLLLAVTNAAWRPRIIQNEIEKFNSLTRSLLTDVTSFETAVEGVEVPVGPAWRPDAEHRLVAGGGMGDVSEAACLLYAGEPGGGGGTGGAVELAGAECDAVVVAGVELVADGEEDAVVPSSLQVLVSPGVGVIGEDDVVEADVARGIE